MQFIPGQHIHFIGVGGFGLSAIARILLLRGFSVSGSDRGVGPLAEALARDGARIHKGHAAEYVNGADLVIASSAVPADHVEVVAAREAGIPVYKRSDVIGPLLAGHRVIAVAGTHGKTTTTAMIAHILTECGLEPGYIVGGMMKNTGTNAAAGRGEWIVVEADEYDNMFHGLRPDVAVLTSVEFDHPDFFDSKQAMMDSFRQFVAGLTADGVLIACNDTPEPREIALERREKGGRTLLYGLKKPRQGSAGVWPDYLAWDSQTTTDGSIVFALERPDDAAFKRLSSRMYLPGKYNIQNAVAALTVAHQLGVDLEAASRALTTFESTGRRFDVRGTAGPVTVVDDYAHHPTAIRACLDAARDRYPDADLWAVWQPHTYTRTKQLKRSYAAAFKAADHVLVTEIYAAREDPIPGVDGATIAEAVKNPDVHYAPDFDTAVDILTHGVSASTNGRARPPVIIIMSAGDAPQIGEMLLARLRGESYVADGS